MGGEIDYYLTSSGECPMKVFLDSLPGKAAAKVLWLVKLVRDLDRVPVVYFSKMSGTNEIWECRTTFGSNNYRVFAFMDGAKVILTHGFIKKTQKTPLIELERAQRYRSDYFERKKRNE